MTQQPLDVLLHQMEINLRHRHDIAQLQEHTRRVREFLSQGYGELVKDLNVVRKTIGNGQKFTEDDFENAALYPNASYEGRHEQKHTLPPLSFGVLIHPDRWGAVARKLNLDPKHNGQSIEGYVFRDSALGVEKSGITFHINRNRESDVEFEILHGDASLYSRTYAEAKKLTREKLVIPHLAQLAVEYMILTDFCAYRTDPESTPAALTTYLQERVAYIADCAPQWLQLNGQMAAEARKVYHILFRWIVERIPEAVTASEYLAAEIGDRCLTPIFFSLGSTPEQLERNHLLSPLIGIAKWADYMKEGKVTKSQIAEILENKGYVD